MIQQWDDLSYWSSQEWGIIQDRLDTLDLASERYYPTRENLFKALDLTPFENTKAMICGQDPYTSRELATGLAFSIPSRVEKFPPTLHNIMKEYSVDLHLPIPLSGDLTKWAEQGVLLWNAVPSVGTWPLSHNYPEWTVLTTEIIENLRDKGIVFAFLGSFAKEFSVLVNSSPNCRVIETSHPSPRGNINSKTPFLGSRLFSRTNDYLNELGLGSIDWRL